MWWVLGTLVALVIVWVLWNALMVGSAKVVIAKYRFTPQQEVAFMACWHWVAKRLGIKLGSRGNDLLAIVVKTADPVAIQNIAALGWGPQSLLSGWGVQAAAERVAESGGDPDGELLRLAERIHESAINHCIESSHGGSASV